MEPTKSSSNSFKNLFSKLKSVDSLLKLVFIAGLIIFMLSLFMFRFELLANLNMLEIKRLEHVSPLRSLLEMPYDLFNGLLQNLSLKALPSHKIIGLRLPTLLMLSSSLVFIASSLYIKFRNRYLPYTYLLLAATSPLIILLSHQGFLPGIDLLFFSSFIVLSFLVITATTVRPSIKKIFLIKGAFALGMLTLQPAGIPIALISAFIISRSTELRYQIIGFKKLAPALSMLAVVIALSLNVLVSIKNHDFIKITSGYEIIKSYKDIGFAALESLKTIFRIGDSNGFDIGTNRPNLLLIGALSLTIYEAIKKRHARMTLLIFFTISIFISALYQQMGSIVLPAVIAPTLIALALANMVRIIDVAFPINPYPRNIAKVLILILITSLASLNLYVFTTATVRQNTPQTVNLKLQNFKD